jgi:hypothetical protein
LARVVRTVRANANLEIVNYVYDAPALLQAYRELLEIEIPEIIAGHHIN